MTAYAELESRFRRLSGLAGAEAVLHWDWAVMMPPGGAEARGEQLAVLSGLAHELLTAPDLGGLLDQAEGESGNLDDWQRANLAEMSRRWRHATALDAALVEALARAATACEMTWREARAADDFAVVAPKLEALLKLVREKAQAKAAALTLSPYDALLDAYDPGTRFARVEGIFTGLRRRLPALLDRVLDRQGEAVPLRPTGQITPETQKALGERLMVMIGFDKNFGRLDVSHHPFTAGVPDDIRITTRYKDGDFVESLMAVLHETGHALYERGLPKVWRGQPVGESAGMSVHESQSLLMEMQACRSDEFIAFAAPVMRRAFGGTGAAWAEANLRRLYRHVAPGLIRVEADELTYPAHILLRTDLERAMVSGDLAVADLPAAWAEGMKTLLGVSVPDDRDGCMQDIHWYGGDFGYFPTYTLGALAAAQVFAAACAADTNIRAGLGRGDFAPLMAWLGEHIHGQGARYPLDELLQRATGEALSSAAYLAHIEARYLS